MVKITQETRFTQVMMMGSRLTVRPKMCSRPSGAPRSWIGPKEAPCKSCKFDKKRYAAMKNGISSSREIAPRRT